MIEVAIAIAAGAVLAGLLWWYDSRQTTEWEDLLSAEDVTDFLRAKFEAEQKALDWSCERAAAAENKVDAIRLLAGGAAFLAALIPERLVLLHRLTFYTRIVGAVAPPPQRMRLRLLMLRRGFAAIIRGGRLEAEWLARAREDFKALDAQTLESCRILLSAVAGDRASGGQER